jgi:hypothetical protein
MLMYAYREDKPCGDVYFDTFVDKISKDFLRGAHMGPDHKFGNHCILLTSLSVSSACISASLATSVSVYYSM